MGLKICTNCNQSKPLSEFYQRKDRKNGHNLCKVCFNRYTIERWIKRKIDAITYKGSKCQDCSINYPEYPYAVFEFHHRKPSEKDVDWSTLKLRSDKAIKHELDKCDLLCANCHRIRHHNNHV